MSNYLLISDAAKEVSVESHVLRYWEEELHLPIKRNEMGHRYYTQDDVERFKQIKSMKERGLQLKAIKMILRDGRLDVLPQIDEVEYGMSINIVENRQEEKQITVESKEDKSKRLQWLLQQLIRETLQENNQQLCKDIKESVIKELDYQFRVQEEREEERERRQDARNEEYYKKMDELLRKKSRRSALKAEKAEKKERERSEKATFEQAKLEKERLEKENTEISKREPADTADASKAVKRKCRKEVPKGKITDIHSVEKKAKKKRHFIF